MSHDSGRNITGDRIPGQPAATTSNAAQLYLRSIPWDLWWIEFCTLAAPGSFTYPTVWHFAKTKTTNPREQKWICESIGQAAQPPTSLPDEEWKRWMPEVEWRGDWALQRAASCRSQQGSALQDLVRCAEEGRPASDIIRSLVRYHLEELELIRAGFDQLRNSLGNEIYSAHVTARENDVRGFRFWSHVGLIRQQWQTIVTHLYKVLKDLQMQTQPPLSPSDNKSTSKDHERGQQDIFSRYAQNERDAKVLRIVSRRVAEELERKAKEAKVADELERKVKE